MRTTSGRLVTFILSLCAGLGASLLTTATAEAFNKERCGHLFPQSDNDHPYYYSPIYVSTMIPSTTSYFSSIGPCSMYGDYQSATRANFIKQALPSIRIDAARGEGEYLKTLAELSGCPTAQYPAVANVMHRQFKTVFAMNGSDQNALSQVARIDAALRSDDELKLACPALN